MNNKVIEALERGIYGAPQIKPEERAIFLSTIIERIYVALTKKQVIHQGMYPEVVQKMKEKKAQHLYINGSLSYSLYSNYVKEAKKHNIPFTIVAESRPTPIGLVLATTFEAINQEEIFIKDDFFALDMDS
ncbi:YueI family protein [Bacillus alkalicellulosilyticus]|uniref:YueI family protein n=1 Tax=Alkalihalobacterium alkalicellulosilyticum TaxID=1912214 RepID=UPI0009969A8C|nr:YueI family protein [Bacillus alkalicellulosilyticus]